MDVDQSGDIELKEYIDFWKLIMLERQANEDSVSAKAKELSSCLDCVDQLDRLEEEARVRRKNMAKKAAKRKSKRDMQVESLMKSTHEIMNRCEKQYEEEEARLDRIINEKQREMNAIIQEFRGLEEELGLPA